MEKLDVEAILKQILVSTKGEIYSRLEQISHSVSIEDTNTKAYCHMLKIDANGNLRLNDLIDYIYTRLVDYAIPKKEIDEAALYYNETGSVAKITALQAKAQHLFTDLGKTGEGGELLLYILTTEILKLPQLISKMSLKTSSHMHYHGADGIHVGFDIEKGNMHLYWGESKMYSSISSAISNCIESLKGFLLDPMGADSVQERDLHLITLSISSNINDDDSENLLVRFFDKDDDFSNHVIYKGICFIGFDSDKYPSQDDLSQTTELLKAEFESQILEWYAEVNKGISKHTNLKHKEIHVFLMPFPSVEDFRSRFLERIRS